MGVKSFRDLEVWQKAFELTLMAYRLTESFPRTEIYGLTQQLRRSSVSIPSNIAEGFKRYSQKEFKYFLRISLGSCAELDTQLGISKELGYLSLEDYLKALNTTDHTSRMLTNLIKKL